MYITFEQLMMLAMFVLALIDLMFDHNNDKKR